LTELGNEQSRLHSLKRGFVNERQRARGTMEGIPGKIIEHEAHALKADAGAAAWAAHPQSQKGSKFQMEVGGKVHDKREDAGDALVAEHRRQAVPGGGAKIGRYGPFSVHAVKDFDPMTAAGRFKVHLKDDTGNTVASAGSDYSGDNALTPAGVTTSIDNALRSLPGRATWHRDQAAQLRTKHDELASFATKPFEHEGRMKAIEKEMAVLEKKVAERAKEAREKKHVMAEVSDAAPGSSPEPVPAGMPMPPATASSHGPSMAM